MCVAFIMRKFLLSTLFRQINSTMSRICLFVLFLGIAVGFGDCENSGNNKNCTKSVPGSDETHLTWFEKIIEWVAKEANIVIKAGPFRKIMDQLNGTNIHIIFPGNLMIS